jgi:predicted RNA-binding Zn-ribbon protein involved in translation (DUF1610 family)
MMAPIMQAQRGQEDAVVGDERVELFRAAGVELSPLELARFPCPFCDGREVRHQELRNGIRSWVCRCGWWRFETPDGVVEEQGRELWEAYRQGLTQAVIPLSP